MTTLDLIYFDAGGGHRAAAAALDVAIREQHRPWRVRRVNLFEALDPDHRFRRVAGKAPEDFYNGRLARGWTVGLAQELKLLQFLIRLAHPSLIRRLEGHWLRAQPDMVVSLVPNFNRALHESLATALPGVPCVTVMTDLADFPPRFWIEPGRTQHLVCASPKAVAQGLAVGLTDRQIHLTSGLIIRPDFYPPMALDRRAGRARLGLDPERPTAVVMFGGHGSMAMLEIARQLADVQLILLCGHNERLAEKLWKQPSSAPRTVVGFTPDVRRHLMLGDFFIGKPGPGCLSEAVQQGLPIVTLRNAATLPQERYNADWVREHGLGIVIGRMREMRPAVAEMLSRLDEFRANVRRLDNRGVFEVPGILADILHECARHEAWRPQLPGIVRIAAAQAVTRASH